MRTPLFPIHKKLGAKFTDFHGWQMPLEFAGAISEVKAVRGSAGVFDISHMGRIYVSGKDAFGVLQGLTTNNLNKLFPGRLQYNLLTNERGGVVDDITVYMISEEEFFLCVNAVNRDKVLNHIYRRSEGDVHIKDVSPNTVQIALQGPESPDVMERFFEVRDLKFFGFKIIGELIISRSGYTGEDGFEIYAPVREGLGLYEDLVREVKPCGLSARDILRIEAGLPLYGNELSEEISPLEAGLDRFVDFSKDFLGRTALKSRRLSRRLTGIEMVDRGIPRRGYKILNKRKELLGEVSSGTYSPILGKGIAMAFLKAEAEESDNLFVEMRGKFLKARLCELPFVKRGRA